MNRTAGIWLTCLLCWLGSAPAVANTVDDLGQWNALFAQGTFKELGWEHDRLRWWFDGHLRLLDDTDGFTQSIVRPGIGWTLDEESAAWIGYGWIYTDALSGLRIDEHRIWQQWTWSKGIDDWKFASRSRLEQRFVDLGNDLGLRYRQLLRVQHNLPAVPKWSLVCWDELFINLNDTDWGARHGFNQNRLFVGVGYKPTKECRWRVEVGYLNQVIELPIIDDRANHILSVNFFRSP
ncbi:MAG: DUF2490 domain-containing protein [Planctomycetota bacterium]